MESTFDAQASLAATADSSVRVAGAEPRPGVHRTRRRLRPGRIFFRRLHRLLLGGTDVDHLADSTCVANPVWLASAAAQPGQARGDPGSGRPGLRPDRETAFRRPATQSRGAAQARVLQTTGQHAAADLPGGVVVLPDR